MPMWNKLLTQDANSPLMEQVIFFHDYVMVILLLILTVVSYTMASMSYSKLTNKHILSSTLIEMIWIVIPTIILVFIALPSLRLLYLLEETAIPEVTIKVLGRQWWWEYEFEMSFPDLLISGIMQPWGFFELLEVYDALCLPFQTHVRLAVTSSDVIHAWTVPALGVKVDAVPGRLNQINIFMDRPGMFYGQCSEICGHFHSYMPIQVHSVSPVFFDNWATNMFLISLDEDAS